MQSGPVRMLLPNVDRVFWHHDGSSSPDMDSCDIPSVMFSTVHGCCGL